MRKRDSFGLQWVRTVFSIQVGGHEKDVLRVASGAFEKEGLNEAHWREDDKEE